MGYYYLSSVTAVDYLPEGKMEVVYHAFRSTGGPALIFRAQAPRDNAVVPSLVPVYPGAEFQEREAWDLFGIRFDGHPDLRRILLWEGFNGHPMRKDWREPYFEEEGKPFKSRWPEGYFSRSEEKNPFHKNVDYPAGFNPETWVPEKDTALYAGLGLIERPVDGSEMHTDQVIVNLGPQHPSTHGVFRMVVSLDGETVLALKPVMGYLHRNHEQIGERNTFLQNMPFTDRLDYLSSMTNNFGYAITVEKLMGIKPPERAEYIRVIMAEFTRLCNHLFAIGTF
jgi:NADH-quinone oxidoreductase subunit D/NADH-quinone oxidoreductase subunit C/D